MTMANERVESSPAHPDGATPLDPNEKEGLLLAYIETQAELNAAELNLRRQQKLLALGSGRKSEVARAEQKLAELKASKN